MWESMLCRLLKLKKNIFIFFEVPLIIFFPARLSAIFHMTDIYCHCLILSLQKVQLGIGKFLAVVEESTTISEFD